MTKTKKTTHIVTLALFAVVCFATASFADSFVNGATMNTLKDFTFGQAVSTADRTNNAAVDSTQGDSFVSEAAMDSLKDFKFGEYDRSSRYTATGNTEDTFLKGDSFVSAEALKTLKSVRTINLSHR